MTEKQQFMKQVIILCDTREQDNKHIVSALDSFNVILVVQTITERASL